MSGVYFIEAVGSQSIKIGWTTKNPEERVKALQTGSPSILKLLGFMPAKDKLAEKLIHDRFSSCRLNGEWFRITSELLLFIKSPDIEIISTESQSLDLPASELNQWCEHDGRGPSAQAKALGISRATLWRLRGGDHPILPDTAKRIELATGGKVKAATLLGLNA